MSSGRGRSPCDTGPRELRLDVICPGTLAAASRRNDGSGCTLDDEAVPERAAITAAYRGGASPRGADRGCRKRAQIDVRGFVSDPLRTAPRRGFLDWSGLNAPASVSWRPMTAVLAPGLRTGGAACSTVAHRSSVRRRGRGPRERDLRFVGVGELWRKGAVELASLMRSGEVSCREVVTAHLQRMDEVNPALNAVVRRLDDEALAAAHAADRAFASGSELGVLHGVPFTVKECIAVAGTPTTLGIRVSPTRSRPATIRPLSGCVRQAQFLSGGRTCPMPLFDRRPTRRCTA